VSITFTRTRLQLADMVLRKLRVLERGVTAASADTDVIYEAMDLRLKEIHRLGKFWRNTTRNTVSVTASLISLSASADVLFPIVCTVVDSSRDEPLEIISLRQYAQIDNKTESGVPQKIVHNGGAEFKLWPVPTSDTTIKIFYESVADDTTAGSAPDVEVSMLRWLKDIIAYDIADDFGVPEQRIPRLERESLRAEMNIRQLNHQNVDYADVMVDDYSPRQSTETDYGA
jgi:hypothetical protein